MSLGGARRDFGFLHQLEQVGLHAAAADVPARGVVGGGDLVDLVDVDDAVLGAGHVAVGQAQQVAHHVFDVAAHIAGLGELGGIGLDERHADQVGRAADQEGLPDAGGAEEDDVLLGVVRRFLAFQGQAHMVVVVAEGDAEDLLGLVLLDDEAVEVILNLARFIFELELVGLGRWFLARRVRRRPPAPAAGALPALLEMLPHQFGELPLKLFRRRRSIENWFVHSTHVTLLATIAHFCNKTKPVTETFQPRDPERFAAALRRFDEANARDPNVEQAGGVAHPRELLYAQRLTEWVLKLCPDASEALRLAARCQHLCRWMVPRDSYPMTRAGYLKWREGLKHFHAQKAGEILREVGYPEETIARVQSLNLKKDFPNDAEGRVLEDALCLVFLEYQFADLASKTTEEKMINALQKAWKKMTPAGQAQALKLSYSPQQQALLEKALQTARPKPEA